MVKGSTPKKEGTATTASWLKRTLKAIVLLLPFIGALAWSAYPAGAALLAASSWRSLQKNVSADSAQLDIRRRAQKHFLNFGIYIPLEDIVAADSITSASENLLFLMRKSCGAGKLYVWVPLRFRLPVLGEKVIEWCMTQH